jgi:hypothetical protein
MLKIFYNKNSEQIQNYVNHHKGFKNFTKYILKYDNSDLKGKTVKFDSIKYSVLLKLRQNDTLQIWGGLHQSNRFDEIEKIQIITNNRDTTEVFGNTFREVFDEKVNGFYLYTVK